jgi:hypothetical protein
MDTSGHEAVAKTAGFPLLAEAFGKDTHALQAFYLGNWLTDVSQFVDPVSVACVLGKLSSEIDNVIDRVLATTFRRKTTKDASSPDALEQIGELIRPFAEDAKRSLHCSLCGLVEAAQKERESPIAAFFRDSFFLIGYFKFVHPEVVGERPRLNFNSYKSVFFGNPNSEDRPGAYAQYYPHEHIDRPEIRLCKGEFAGRESSVPPGTRSPRKRETPSPDMYPYVRDGLEITAGLLSEVDADFTSRLSNKSGATPSDDDWCKTLAKLGHALHFVEDFFSHSNWTELAIKGIGKEALERHLPSKLPFDFLNRARITFARRLKQFQKDAPQDWTTLPDEDWVVTGFFGGIDAIFSLAHAGEELFGLSLEDPVVAARNAARKVTLDEVRKFLGQSLEFLCDPVKALGDPENEVAASFKKRFGGDAKSVLRKSTRESLARDILANTPLFRDLVSDARADVSATAFRILVEGARVFSAGKLAFKLYEAVRDICEFVSSPLRWLLKSFVPEFIRERLDEVAGFYVKELIVEQMGGYRIGCHTLLAKDHESSFLYGEQKNCATSIHWYIVKTLLRNQKKAETRKPIDWLELLEHFLRNPLTLNSSSPRVTQAAVIGHVIEAGEQLACDDSRFSLETKFKRTAVDPSRFTWRLIADVNFGTSGLQTAQAQKVINATLKDRAWGVPVRPPNYAFKPGLVILIPDQLIPLASGGVDLPGATWFQEILSSGEWRKSPEIGIYDKFPEFDDYLKNCGKVAHQPLSVGTRDTDAIALRGRTLRKEKMQAYAASKTDLGSATRDDCKCGEKRRDVDPVDALLESKKPNLSLEERELVDRIVLLRAVLKFGFRGALDALDHYLLGTGSQVEIVSDYAAFVRKRSQSSHVEQFLLRLRNGKDGSPAVASSSLALHALMANGIVLQSQNWPNQYTDFYKFESGLPEDLWSVALQTLVERKPDWLLTYFNAKIASRVKVKASRIAGTRKYSFEIIEWQSWVTDNYDWDSTPHDFTKRGFARDWKKLIEHDRNGRKRYGGAIGEFADIPSNDEMQILEKIMQAKAYQRSSRSWGETQNLAKWDIDFATDVIVAEVASRREAVERTNRMQVAVETAAGGLPTPPPFGQPDSN